jgi:hypothetical protein
MLVAYLDPGDDPSLLESILIVAVVFLIALVVIAVVLWAIRSIRRGTRP